MIVILKIIIALGLLNVWIVRFDKETPYRGGGASNMIEEFKNYGLPITFMYSIGLYKVLLSLFILYSLFFGSKYDQLVSMGLVFLSFIMVGSIIMHLRVKDPLNKSNDANINNFIILDFYFNTPQNIQNLDNVLIKKELNRFISILY